MKSRIFNIMQYKLYPETLAPLLDEDTIKVALSHKTIKRWAYIYHDKDHYSEKDFDDDNNHTPDKTKPGHFHIVIECSQQVEVHTIAKWFGIADNFIDCPKGAGAFLDCVEYLTHEETRQQELDKYHYPDEEVKSNFDFREELIKRAERRARYGKDLDEKGQMLLDIQDHGMTLLQAWKKDSFLYGNNISLFQKARQTYLSHMPAPALRLNFYVWSKHGGDGKGLASRALARQFYPDREDEEIFFNVNADTMFNGYDGQPVLIWNDFRAYELLKALGGRGSLFDVFDTHPVKQLRNVKYSTVALVNTVNIVNSIQNYREFLDGLAGEYKDKDGNLNEVEDKTQSYRRFPFIMEVRLDSYEYLVNAGYVSDDKSYTEFIAHKNVRAGFKALNEALDNNTKLLREFESKALVPMKERIDEVTDKLKKKEITEDEARKMFEEVGKEIEPASVAIFNDLTENALDVEEYKKKAHNAIDVLRWKFSHDVCKYVMPESVKRMLLDFPEGSSLLYDIMQKYGSDAIVIDEESREEDWTVKL